MSKKKYWLDVKTGVVRKVDDRELIKWREEIGPGWPSRLVRIHKQAYQRIGGNRNA